MNLYKEIKLWEALWDDPARTYTDDETNKLVDELLSKYSDFVFEYASDVVSYTYEDVRYPDFEYSVEPGDLYEFLLNPRSVDKLVKSSKKTELIATYEKLQKEYFGGSSSSKSKQELEELGNKLCIFIAENLEGLYNDAYSFLFDWYAEDAVDYILWHIAND
jgi:hypothetical protein